MHYKLTFKEIISDRRGEYPIWDLEDIAQEMQRTKKYLVQVLRGSRSLSYTMSEKFRKRLDISITEWAVRKVLFRTEYGYGFDVSRWVGSIRKMLEYDITP